MEIIDLVDEKDNVIGQSTIKEALEKHLLHRAVHIVIINEKVLKKLNI